MAERFDIAVLGGGCAGLSLGVGLTEAGLDGRRLVVLEDRKSYERDRTWCSWSVRPHRFERCVSHRWSRWSVREDGEEIVHSSDQVAYEHIPADAFYDEALGVLERESGAQLRTGVAVLGAEEHDDTVSIATSRGRVEAGIVIDTRPPVRPLSSGDARPLLQHFAGWHVRMKADTFDPTTVTLMDFDVPQSDGIHFFYVLPFSRREALVEATFLSPHVLPQQAYQTRIGDYIAWRYGGEVEKILWKESGVIPMVHGRPAPVASQRILRAGSAAAATKPSNGYAFLNIQRHTEELVRELSKHELPRERSVRGRVADLLDRVFLRFLAREPESAPAAFARLFRSVSSEPLARFLMEEGGFTDHLRVVGAMPKLPFLRAALSSGEVE